MDWNVLARAYCNKSFYPYADEADLDFRARKRRIDLMLEELNPDVMTLQEFDFLKKKEGKFLSGLEILDNYRYEFFRRSRVKKDGCLIAWRPELFSLKRKFTVKMNELADLIDPAYKDFVLKDNISLGVVLKSMVDPSAEIFVITTHLHFHPEREVLRILQLRLILQKLKEFIFANGLDRVPIIFTGDFNMLPDSKAYHYLTRASKFPPEIMESSEVKLLLFGDLHRVCRWLRMLAIDTEFVKPESKDGMHLKSLLNNSKDEKRIVVTQSKRIIERKDCSRFILLPQKMNPEQVLKHLVRSLGVESLVRHNINNFITRCVLCNAIVEKISKEEARKHPDKSFTSGENDKEKKFDGFDDLYTFFECVACTKLYWWGPRSHQTIETVEKIIFSTGTDVDDSTTFALIDKSMTALADECIDGLEFCHEFNFQSALKNINGSEPDYTNFRNDFVGTLDYIFIHNPQVKKKGAELKCLHAGPLPDKSHLTENLGFPNGVFPSDHIPISARFSLSR